MITEYIQRIDALQTELDNKTQSILHLRSMRNFLYHYDSLTGFNKEFVINLIEGYFNELSQYDSFDELGNEESENLYWRYIQRIGVIYAGNLKFKTHKVLGYSIIWGIIIDLTLFLAGFSKTYYYIPIATIFFIVEWRYTKQSYERHNKIFGPLY
jgi:hypothetical protein